MYHFFDPSLLPVTTTDQDGNILYVRTHGLHYYGYPDLIAEHGGEEEEQLLLDILDGIFSLTFNFNVNTTWNYNGKLIKLELGNDELVHVVYTKIDAARIITILNIDTGQPVKHISKGLSELYDHPDAEIAGDIYYGKEILRYLIEQVKGGMVYDDEVVMNYRGYVYGIHGTCDRMGKHIVEIQLLESLENQPKTNKRKPSHLTRIK